MHIAHAKSLRDLRQGRLAVHREDRLDSPLRQTLEGFFGFRLTSRDDLRREKKDILQVFVIPSWLVLQ